MSSETGVVRLDRDSGPLHRIRHITGVRIHQLTLPESLSLASKLIPEDELEGYPLGGPSRLTSSPDNLSRRDRRRSSASHHTLAPNDHQRERSASNSTLSPAQNRIRNSRPRASTLVGEAIEHGGPVLRIDHVEEELPLMARARRLARYFVVLKLPTANLPSGGITKKTSGRIPGPKRSSSGDHQTIPPIRRTPSSPTMTPPMTPAKERRPPLSTSSSRSSLSRVTSPQGSDTTTRSRTTSLTSPSSRSNSSAVPMANGRKAGRVALGRSLSARGIPPTKVSVDHERKSARPGLGSPRNSIRTSPLISSRSPPTRFDDCPSPDYSQLQSPSLAQNALKQNGTQSIPFYISPIHHPSTQPRYLNLEPGDFAAWPTIEEYASSLIEVEVWYEDDPGSHAWKQLEITRGPIDLSTLRRVNKGTAFEDNTLQFTLSSDPDGLYYLPPEDGGASFTEERRETVKGIVERSMRETRMKKGVGVGALHQLVNIQAVVIDTQRGIAEVQAKIDKLLNQDTDARALRRSVEERTARVRWIEEKVGEVGKTTREGRARVTLREQGVQSRRTALARAQNADELLRARNLELESQTRTVETDRINLQPRLHHWRSHHIQNLDALFPITPISPGSLLYSLLNIPLPIPTGPKDPAPPLSLPSNGQVKVDEKTIAAALGYVAMMVQVLGNLGGTVGGLPYPVTCNGSRSLVRDVVSVMQGPRSFPLYAKGVERYRYEYAVFLLNKNIEMLMQESNIRLLDIRHTLPNLKSLLLTLSSSTPPPSRPPIADSRANSRQTSRAWSFTPMPHSPTSSGVGTPSPMGNKGRKSRLGVGLGRSGMRGFEGDTDEEEEEKGTEGGESEVGESLQ